ncbi:enoyl-CoA hydratase [Alicycliphilus denitrificans]|uniref:Enoyl-CoA hydratase n=1 Tax=Alicycliphilus denitrificans TaxID=179636 RepID=A0A420KIZ7_9BURK|nr:enoyl-CoA hydratase-related protein [Alicycliphilus denitrificans]MBN9573846.1 enoyl-CoA hydratase/isomerase family protein [Alicycliphilus denitrificans]OJW83586.1 MAG: enoyl-CoA hydratase [Alicycliphilus sp. 69-12]RKJ99928.1 enoyl-CoA hydratase [Alicycliphilus denitrificans]BCN38982.1 enoyl-CoA hydratase [Alicycliphilus denitrificans]
MSSIDIERRDAVAVVTMNNPAGRNALDLQMRQDLLTAVREVSEDDAVRAVVLTGAGDAFCAGADVGKMGGRGLAGSRQRMKTMHAMVRAVHGMDKPVVAAVRGAAVGIGFSLAMACDVVVAAPGANFSQVFTQVGLAPDGGAIWFLARQMGFSRAKELVFSARRFTGEEAACLGLVQRLVSDDRVLDEALGLAAQYARGPGLALAMAKQLFAHSVSPTLEQFLEMELLVGPQLSQTLDHAEGRAAFREKRKPQFKGG